MDPRTLQTESPSFDLRPILAEMWRERGRVALVVLGAMVLAFGVSLLLPRWYKATAVIMPPEESDLLSNMSMAQRALTKFPIFGILDEYYTPADLFKAVLQSRTVQEEVIDKFDLQRLYHLKSREKTVKALKTHYAVKMQPDGTISVSVEDPSPQRAAAMANTFLAALDRYNVERRNSQARRTREFLERRVADTDSALKASELALRVYQELHNTVAPPSAASADMQAAADLMARKIQLEVRLGVLRSYLREDNEQVLQARTELEQLKSRIADLPALQSDLLRLMRDQKIQEQLYLLLTSELEQARIRETMDTPTVQLLDAAIPPEKSSKPKRGVMTGLAGVLSLAGCGVWAAGRLGRPVSGA